MFNVYICTESTYMKIIQWFLACILGFLLFFHWKIHIIYVFLFGYFIYFSVLVFSYNIYFILSLSSQEMWCLSKEIYYLVKCLTKFPFLYERRKIFLNCFKSKVNLNGSSIKADWKVALLSPVRINLVIAFQ